MELTFSLFDRGESEALAEFLSSDSWPFHVGPSQSRESAMARIDGGEFDGNHDRTYWIVVDDARVGIVHIEDLGDDTPLFDLRLRSSHRGRGLGTRAVKWLTTTLFNEFPDLNRIEATTRQDNLAMRRVLAKCHFAKEAHYRQAWPSASGWQHDSIGYGLLRNDWMLSVTTPVDWNDGP
jgi:RimJ/RimL family protein N-acetyltransferase